MRRRCAFFARPARSARSSLAALIVAAAAVLVSAAPLPAQETDSIRVTGRVIDAAGAPVAGHEVLLHRVADGAGATIAVDTTDDDGAFTLAAGGLTPATEAAHFVAARYEGELYIGAPFRSAVPEGAGYTVQVGVPGTSASALLGNGQTRSSSGVAVESEPFPYRMWLLLIIPLLVVALAAGYMLTRQRGPLRRRRTLLAIAELDEAHENALTAGHVPDSTLYWAERRELLEQLARES